ncbi:MAG: transporter substrate-binding domain-containing protein [Clostridiales bacterium]
MKKTLKILTVAFMAMLLTMSFAACGGKDKAEDTTAEAETDTFRVGMECGYAPFNWTQIDDKNGAVAINGGDYAGGYDVEIAKLLADGMGKKLEIVKTSWDGLPQGLDAGTIDAIIAGMSATADRAKIINFSDMYYNSVLVMVVKKDGDYANATSLKDFTGAKITGQLNTFHASVVDQIPGVVKQTPMEDFPAMRVALESGVIDGYVSERPEGLSAAAANDNFKTIEFAEGQGFTYTPEDVAISVGVKKGNDTLLADINKVLAGITEEQRLEIMDQAVKNQPAAQ